MKFKFDDLRTVSRLVGRGWFMASLDIADAYHHIPVEPESRKLLAFRVGDEVFVCNVLPFGLTSAPWYFSKVLRVVIRALRREGVFVSAYLDDVFVTARTREELEAAMRRVEEIVQRLGFRVNEKKSAETWTPSQRLQYLGVVIDSTAGTFSVPQEKLRTLKEDLESVAAAEGQRMRARSIARLAGRAVCWWRALARVRLYTRSLYAMMSEAHGDLDMDVVVSAQAAEDARTLAAQLESWNGRCVWRLAARARMECDASDHGWGGWLEVVGRRYEFSGAWTDEEAARSSTWRETVALHRLLQQAASSELLCRGLTIQMAGDNAGLVYNLRREGGGAGVWEVTRKLLEWLWVAELELVPIWIPREQNREADELSRLAAEERGRWSCDPQLVREAVRRWPDLLVATRTVDRFASEGNHRFDRFNTWRPSRDERYRPRAEAVDAFTCDWGAACNWLAPPVAIVDRVLAYLVECRASAVACLPRWEAAAWWPRLLQLAAAPPADWISVPDEWLHPASDSPDEVAGGRWSFVVLPLDGRRVSPLLRPNAGAQQSSL